MVSRTLLLFTIFIVGGRLQFEKGQLCFCWINNSVEQCSCDNQNNIDQFNNGGIHEKLQKILKKDFFRFYKVNMDKECPFWPNERQCGSKQCGIAFCDEEVPDALRRSELKQDCTKESNNFDPMDRSILDAERTQLDEMDTKDFHDEKFCEIDDFDSENMHYVDLKKNPERYTGYQGNSPQRVWKSIYEENCFKPDPKFDKNFLTNPNSVGMCLEKRVFYKLISGLHSAITISIAAYNYKPPAKTSLGAFGSSINTGTWFRNTDMFVGRFGTKWSWEGPERLRNVYFVYMLELKALLKLAPYIKDDMFFTGNEKEDEETRTLVRELLDEVRKFPDHFDESEMFTGDHARELREEFRSHFVNISRIMDCVECDKCRLWGKVQTHGMGTALKLLFSSQNRQPKFQVSRNEIVALLQSFGRYSSSIVEVEQFRAQLYPNGEKEEL